MFSKLFVVFSVLLVTAQAGKERLKSQGPISITHRVLGGSDAVANQFPYQISFQRLDMPNTHQHFCGGTIINSQWILTAAHCLDEVSKFKVRVKAGITNLRSPVKTEQVADIAVTFVHGQYKPATKNIKYLNDIALLKLKKPLILNEAVKKIGLPKYGSKPPTGTGLLSGWGSMAHGDNADYPDKLQWVALPIIDNDTCEQLFKHVRPSFPSPPHIPRTQFCTQTNVNNKIVASCNGDSGGPLIQKNKASGVEEVIGIVSWGSSHCDKSPSVYTTVSEYTNWILETMKRN